MKASEMLELARAGYKPNEIAEMHKLMKEADPEDSPKDEPKNGPKDDPKDEPKDDPKDEPKDDPEDEPKDDPEDDPEDDPKDAEIEKLKRELAEAQEKNRHEDNSGKDKKTNDEKMADIVRGFF